MENEEKNAISEKATCESSKMSKSEIEIELDTEVDWTSTISTLAEEDSKPLPPEIPVFTERLRIADISPEIERRLAMSLDLPPVGTSLRNWEWLAFTLGMTWEEIKYLRIRAQHPSSPTSELLWRFREESFGRLLYLIRDSLNRMDIIVELMPALLALEETLKLDNKGDGSRKKVEKNEYQDSGVLSSNASCSRQQAEASTSHHNVNSLFNLRVSSSSSFNDINVKDIVEQVNATASENPVYILVTYNCDNEKHVKLVKWLCKNLRQSGAQVVSTDQVLLSYSDDLATGFTRSFQKSSFIVVVCSSGYRRCVESDVAASAMDVHSQYTLFLHKLMFSEYKELNCRNRRFRPVLFEGSTDADVPSFLKNTLVHRWPQQHDAMMKFFFNDDERT